MVKENEFGRSLTEMMGTLAIMGILAIAGIWMYHSAMDRLKANTIINEAQKRAVVVAGQIGFQGRTDPSLGEFSDNEFAGGTFSTDVIVSGLYGQFGVKVENVGKNICQNILNAIGTDTPIRRVTYVGDSQTAITSCADNNNLLLVYNNDMSTSGGDTAYAADDCGCQTVCGVCVMEGGVSTCRGECPATGTCSSSTDCSGECVGCVIPSGETTGTCQVCQRVEYLESDGEQYIDTGIAPGSLTYPKAKLKFMSLSTTTNSTERGIWGTSGPNNNRFGIYSNSTSIGKYKNHYWTGNQNYVVILDAKNTQVIINNQPDNSREYTNQNGFVTTHNLYLFKMNYVGRDGLAQRLYYCKIGDNDALVRDFVPVLDPWGVPAMYDKVNHQLYYNAGSGSFTYGNN